jgi:RHS repeat-associated protein
MVMPGRKYSAGSGYRYGFNGKENDNEVKAEGNQQDYGMRIYDTRLGKFLSVDPITRDYPELTPYQFASNRPIDGIDLDGLEFAEYGYPHSRIQERYKNAKTPEELERIRKQDRRGMLIAGGMLGAGFIGAGALTYGTLTLTTTIRVVTSPQIATAITSGATIVGKYGPDAANFVYGIVTGDATEPIPTNTGSQTADVGVAFRNIFKAPVEISGFFKKAGVESAILIKGSKGGKVAIIGQGMDKVKQVASGVKNAEIFKPSVEAVGAWNDLLIQYKGKIIPDEVVKKTKIFQENQSWISDVKAKGYDVLDTGGGSTSTFYNMEKEAVYGKPKK